MKHTITKRKSWKAMLHAAEKPVQLPVAHDALTARLIEQAGFDAYQIGGYALSGASHAMPDVDLEKFGEKKIAAINIIQASHKAVNMDQFMEIVDLPYWKAIEEKYEGKSL
ncbi:MAG TPA: isocitrate lyase/phosphoenolpyruvate mutase family protein [Mucilaginibacter sp.]|jgi:2-methylisocitrate lyase-like PEP mutase family enzyme